jgi:hypothetical protein
MILNDSNPQAITAIALNSCLIFRDDLGLLQSELVAKLYRLQQAQIVNRRSFKRFFLA